MKRVLSASLAACAMLTGCGDDGAVTPQGGQAFEAPFTTVAAVRTPGIVARAFGRTVNNAAVVDSVVGEVSLLKPLDGRARYQFYIVNGLDSSATPVSHRQWIIRTDSLLDANGNITSPIDTNRTAGVRDFYAGNFFGRRMRFAVTLSATDSVQQRAAWLVLTIQSDSTSTAYTATTPRPLFVRFRDQKGTPTRDDDLVIPDTLRGSFGDFISPARQVTFRSAGTGSLLFWDVAKTGVPAIRVDFTGLQKPPRGYFYQPFIIDSISGVAYAWGLPYDAAEAPLRDADIGTDSILPTLRAVQPVNTPIGAAENYTRVELILEPKAAAPALATGLSIYSLMSLQRANIPDALRNKRAALGVLQAIVTRGTQGGPVAPNVGVVVQAPGNNFNTLIGNKNTDSTGTARFTNMPIGELRVLAVPFGGSAVETRATIVSGQTATVRLVVP
ncbi:MAG: hypothetical protein V4813_09840 [Gemmatimonadota bacterium]